MLLSLQPHDRSLMKEEEWLITASSHGLILQKVTRGSEFCYVCQAINEVKLHSLFGTYFLTYATLLGNPKWEAIGSRSSKHQPPLTSLNYPFAKCPRCSYMIFLYLLLISHIIHSYKSK